MQIPLSQPDIGQAEIDAVVEVLRSGRLSLGPTTERFERLFAEFVGTADAVAVSSGTAGLHLCLQALDIGPEDEVITTPFSFVASANVLLYQRARPVFVDIDPQTWLIDAERIEAAITPRTRGILPVHVFGQTCGMDRINAIADRHGLTVIEDACEALGGGYAGRSAGSLAKVGTFAFYPNKQITTGEGGMVTTNDRHLAELIRSLRNHGRPACGKWLAHERLGYNYRITEMSSALGVVQLGRAPEMLANRARVAQRYRRQLADEPRLVLQHIEPQVRMSWFVMVVRLADQYSRDDRDRMISQLRSQGIASSDYFPPIHLLPFYRRQFGLAAGDFPVCEHASQRTIALPFHGQLTDTQVDTVCQRLRELL